MVQGNDNKAADVSRSIDGLVSKYSDACEDLSAGLRKIFPAGKEIEFILRHGQYNPSSGEIVGTGVFSGPEIRVRMRTGTIKCIHPNQVC